MTNNEIIKANDILDKFDFFNQPADYEHWVDMPEDIKRKAIEDKENDIKFLKDLINRQQKENENLEYKLLGVMHFVDKWLSGAELEQDEVNRADTMREKTLQIVETAKTNAIKEFAKRLKKRLKGNGGLYSVTTMNAQIDNLVKEMVGEE